VPPKVVAPDKRLERIIDSKRVSTGDLDFISDLLLKGDLNAEDANRILDGKIHVRSDPDGLKTRKNFRIAEEENLVRIEKLDGSKIGDFLYSLDNSTFGTVMIVHELYVQKPYQHRGYGHRLMEYAEKIAKRSKANSIMVEVDRDNPRAIDFFTGLDYREISATNTGNIDRLTLVKELR
jgi:GNAT superfamily N-acetyltransferase